MTATTTFINEDIYPNNVRQNVSKNEILDMLNMVKSSLQKAWFMSCGGRKKRLQKLETLDELTKKIESCPDDMNLSMVLEDVVSTKSCAPPLFGMKRNKLAERQLNASMRFLDEHMNREGEESDDTTMGKNEQFEMMTAHSHESSENSSVFTASNYDADTERCASRGSSSFGLSEDSSDVVVTTCNVESDLGPLGVSITTWNRRHLSRETMRPTSASSDSIAEATKTSDSDDNDDDGSLLEEVSVSIGDKIVVRASRTRSVRFTGVKPSTEDNINRAMELLENAKLMRQKMVGGS